MSLSMIIYLADVLPNIASFLGCVSFFGCAILLVLIVHIKMTSFDKEKVKKYLGIFYGFLFCGLVGAIIPSQNTIYLMAGANATQQLADTPEAAKARKALNLGLDKIIMNLQESK